MPLKMPDRLPTDGAVNISRDGEDRIIASVTSNDVDQSINMSLYNAWRLFGMLSLMLEIPLSAKISKAIKFGSESPRLSFGPSEPLKTLGDRVAWNLHKELVKEKLIDEGYTLEENDK